MIGRKAARDGSEKPQKNSVLRTLQLLQSSSIGKPYGVRVLLLRSSVLCRGLETSGLSATIEFGIWPFLFLRSPFRFALAERQLEGLTGVIRSFWSIPCKTNKMNRLFWVSKFDRARLSFRMKPALGHFPQNCVSLITLHCDV
jgi:hypothetical protein